MHEHRTIPQRLGDHDVFIAQLLERVEELERLVAALTPKPAPKEKP
jgi:hypothetical protein